MARKFLYESPESDEILLQSEAMFCTSTPFPVPDTGGEDMDDPENLD